MPLPERPNVGEFIPTVEPPAPRRRSFRWRVVPVTILALPTAGLLAGAVVAALELSRRLPLVGSRGDFLYFTNREFFAFSFKVHAHAWLFVIGPLLAALVGAVAIWAFARGRWRIACAAVLFVFAMGVAATPLFYDLIPWAADRIAEWRYPVDSYHPSVRPPTTPIRTVFPKPPQYTPD